MLPSFARECVADEAFERHCMGQRIGAHFSGYGCLWQNCKVQVTAVLPAGFVAHPVDDGGELVEAHLQTRMLLPKRLHHRTDDDLARRQVRSALGPDWRLGTAFGRRRYPSASEKCSPLHFRTSDIF